MESMRRSALVLLFACVSGCLAADRGMTFPGKDWEPVAPAAEGVSPKKLAAAVRYLEQHAPRDGVQELLIVRNGRILHAGPRIDKVHGIWSCTKSFTSTVLGLLIDDGKCTLDTRVKEVLPAMARDYPELSLRHFTTMTSGYRAQGDEPQGSYSHGPSRTPFAPGPPLFQPGSHYAYWDSAMNQFANALTRIAGEPIEELFRRRIAEPIGMNPEQWNWGDFGIVEGLVVNGGSGNGNRHMFISAREMARFGHLFLNRGQWSGRQLISASWVEQAARTQVPASVPRGHLESGIEGPGMYGFNWWTNGIKPDGKRKWEGIPSDVFSASGHNNNDMFVIPSWGMVVVRLGLDQEGEGGFAISDATYAAFLRLLGEAPEHAK
jgi:CubicO group peptidase (beta-lactamase class C family)